MTDELTTDLAAVFPPVKRSAADGAALTGAVQPNRSSRTIGLCMIVKNETKVIRRCLESALPLVDYILVVDTGSTDGTQQTIRDFLSEHNVAGSVIEEPWRDFAYNRSFALERLREVEGVDHVMILDADDTIELDAGFDPSAFKAQMTLDLYDVPVRHGEVAHHRPQLFSNRLPFCFKGVVHEYLEAPPGGLSRGDLKGFVVHATTGGARSQNPHKYEDDAAALKRALDGEIDPFLVSRYTFYLAQSYRDCGQQEEALGYYLKRADLGYWIEEVYVSLFEAGNLMAALRRPFDQVIATYERATEAVPARAEALYAASRYCRDNGKNIEGMEIARRGLSLTLPNGLFLQPWVYEYGILDEFAINSYWAGAYRESLDASLKLLTSDQLPTSIMNRVAANARFAAAKIPGASPPDLGSLGSDDLVKQHAMAPQRPLRSRLKSTPLVMVAILAKQKEPALPLYLECIEALDYPKSSIVLYIRTNNNTDKTEELLRDWAKRVEPLYRSVQFDSTNVPEKVEQYREHEWNAARFGVLGRIRNESMRRARELSCDFYFVADVDNFIRPATLRELVALDLPIAAPMLRSIDPGRYYSNYHAEVDPTGYYKNCDQYLWILTRYVRGVIETPVVHCTYLIRADVIPELNYDDGSRRHEYVVLSDTARKAGIPQYLDNRQVYGYITFGEGADQFVEGGIERARLLLRQAADGGNRIAPIYVVNLDRSTERLATFYKRNSHLRDVIRVPAVNGQLLDREALVKAGLLTRDCSYRSGAIGCAISHVELWRKALRENRAVTVFEDDAIATYGFQEKAERIISTLPEDWDFIQWGYNFDPLYVWANFGFSKANLRFYDQQFIGEEKVKFQSADLFPTAVKLAHSYGTVAYSVSPGGARVLLEHCLPFSGELITFPGTDVVAENSGVDCAMNKAYDSMRAYICIPPLVLEDERESDRLAVDGANELANP
jgi:GR25 family glycosyltransferase involved in LPS biosynthesis/glycosyltransferase involved in cell wall biosynthesis